MEFLFLKRKKLANDHGEVVTIVRYNGLNIQIFEGRNEWESVTALANAAAEYAFEQGFIHANYLQ